MNRILMAASLLGPGLLATPAAAQSITISAGVETSTGDYGTDESTDIIYVPFSAAATAGAWTLRATLPWLDVTGPGVFAGDGVPLVRGGGAVTGRDSSGSASGLGDASLSITRVYDLSADAAWQLDLTGRIKLPTGDSGKGLSTGEPDFSIAADLTRSFDTTSVFAGAGYRVTGDPEGLPLADTWFASAGLARQINASFGIGAAVDFNQAQIAGVSDATEFSGWVTAKLSDQVRVQLYGFSGVSDSAPDRGIGLRLVLQR